MTAVHRENDLRVCTAQTIVSNQSTVRDGGKLIAVVGDECDHIDGDFIENGSTVKIGGLSVITVGDSALSDAADHPSPSTDAATGSGTVSIGGM